MKQNEENSQKAQELTQEELENVNGGGGGGIKKKRKIDSWHMRDGSFCALLVAAAEPSNTERTVLSVCDSHGSDFGCLSQMRLSVAYSPDENQQKVRFVRNVVVSLQS